MASRKVYLALVALTAILIVGACTPDDDSEQAEVALREYFSSLYEGNYAAAAELYGGDYDQLLEWNPELTPNDRAMLLQRGCLVNGLVCLPIGEIGAREHSGPDTYEITVQFQNPDGTLYSLGSADAGAAGQEAQSDFTYTVVRSGDGFVVRELPPYAD